jgi:chromate reductase, NAD(P)H dehydrogenase (quinone)
MADLKVLGISGSLRKASLNTAVLRYCAETAPADMKITVFEGLGDIPMYNQEILDAGVPESVKKLRAAVDAADGLLLACPEYNFSFSAAMKNAIDWLSRLPNQPFMDKPIAVVSASQGPLGGARVQYDARRVLTQLWGHVMPRPEVFIGLAPSKFDAQGKLTDETTKKFLGDLLAGFRTWIVRMQVKKA